MNICLVSNSKPLKFWRTSHNDETGEVATEVASGTIDESVLKTWLVGLANSHKSLSVDAKIDGGERITVEIPYDLGSLSHENIGDSSIPVFESTADLEAEKAELNPSLLLYNAAIKTELQAVINLF